MILTYEFMLQLVIAVPLIAAVLLLFSNNFGSLYTKSIALVGFLFPAIVSICLWVCFNDNASATYGDYVFYSNLSMGLEPVGISLKLGLNGISLPLFVLAGVVGLAAGLYALQSNAPKLSLYLMLLLVMQAGLMGTFASIDIFFFYFFHELALIPTFIMIGVWGGRGKRMAAMEMTIYLTVGAMLVLIGLIALYANSNMDVFDLVVLKDYLKRNALTDVAQKNIFALLMFGFGILVSLFPFHSWAPKGYAAAPASAAMLHAGVLKKFGLYGLVQIAAPLLPSGAFNWGDWLVWLAVGNIIIIGFVTIAQRDLKQMIGYSSVMHMGYCFLGIACMSTLGLGGAVMLMVAHGVSVALLFMLSTSLYQRTGTYMMDEMGGVATKAPVLASFFIIATLANIGLPGLANFWGEVSIFFALWDYSSWVAILAILGVLISAIYGLRAVASVFWGQENDLSDEVNEDLRLSEKIPVVILVVMLLVIGFWPKSITENLNTALNKLDVAHRIEASQGTIKTNVSKL